MGKSITERFWNKVEIKGANDCWEWQGGKNSDGYGNVGKWQGKWWKAHQLAYILTNGGVPQGLCVCHSCDRRSCCNPNHLWLGTHLENMRDMTIKRRAWGTKLTESDVRKIREMSAAGYSEMKLGELFGVNRAQINRVVKRICWKHVP